MATSQVVIINHFLPTRKKKEEKKNVEETSEGVADRSTDAADTFVGSGRELKDMYRKGPSGAQTAR